MANKIQVKRGVEANLPVLDVGEPAFTTDTKKPFIGSKDGNIELATKEQINTLDAQALDLQTNKMDKTTTDIRLSQINKTYGLIDESYLSDTLKAQMAGTTNIGSTPPDYSIVPNKTTFFKTGKNMFDKNAVKVGFMFNVSGAEVASANYRLSDYIKVETNTSYFNNKIANYVVFYDANKTILSVVAQSTLAGVITTPVNTVYIRFDIYHTNVATTQLELGTVATSYEAYYQIIPKELTEKHSFSIGDISDNSIPIKKTNFVTVGKNLFDKSVAIANKYVNNVYGNLEDSTTYSASDYVEISPSTQYTENYGYMLAFYDVNKTFISGLETDGTGTNPRTFTTPSNSKYMRCSLKTANLDTFQVELGVQATSYEPYCYKFTKDLNANILKPEIVLPPTVYGVVGKEINIYFANVMNNNPEKYQINVDCSIGKQQKERWTAIPSAAGTFLLTIKLYKEFVLVQTVTTNIVITNASVGNGLNKKCLFIGDSTTAAAIYTNELLNLFGVSEPMDITLLGSRGTTPNLHEGRSGWTAKLYVTSATDGGVSNAFWNSGTSAFDFTYYMNQRGYIAVDYVGIHLGINDVFSLDNDTDANTESTNVLARLQTMINSIKAFNSNIKIAMLVTIPPSISQDAFGASYLCGQNQWRYKRNNYIWVKSFIEYFKGKEAQGIYLVPINVNLDTVNNMKTETVAVNSRNTTQVIRQFDGVHPDSSGYYQMADEIYYFLKSFES